MHHTFQCGRVFLVCKPISLAVRTSVASATDRRVRREPNHPPGCTILRIIPQTGFCRPIKLLNASVAQLDRVLGYEPSGRRFESSRMHHTFQYEHVFLVCKPFSLPVRTSVASATARRVWREPNHPPGCTLLFSTNMCSWSVSHSICQSEPALRQQRPEG